MSAQSAWDAKLHDLSYRPHKGQSKFHKSRARFRMLSCGRRWGKSKAAVREALKLAMQKKNSIGWVVAPIYSQVMVDWRKFFQECPREYIRSVHRSEKYIELYNGSTIWMKSADNPDHLRGEGLDWLILDECGMIKRDAWEYALRPALTDKLGKLIAIGTPKGHNFFFELWTRGEDPEFPNYESWEFDSKSNPYFPLSEWEEEKRTQPARVFEQEYMGKFIKDLGEVFRNIKECTAGKLTGLGQGIHYMGVDLAKYQDFTVITIINNNKVVHFDRFKDIDWTFQKTKIIETAKRYNFAHLVLDSTGVGDPIFDDLRKLNIENRFSTKLRPYKFTNLSKKNLIENLIVVMENGDITFPDIPELINELRLFTYKIGASGLTKYSAPEGYHDDCLKKGTLIKTLKGYEPIEDLFSGQLVLTHKNRYQPIEKVIKKPFNNIFYKLEFQGQLDLELSYNHPLYIARRNYENNITGHYTKRSWIYPEQFKKTYRQVSIIEKLKPNRNPELTEDMYYSNSRFATNIKLRKLILDRNFAKFLGLFLAEGSCHKHGIYRMSIAFNKKEIKLINELTEYLFNLGITTRPKFYEGDAFAIEFSSKLLYHILLECYDKNKEKQLPWYARELGTDLGYVLDYWLKGDSWYRKKYRTSKGHSIGATTSKSLGLSMRDISMSIYKYASIRKVKRHRYDKPTKDQYWVTIYPYWLKESRLRLFNDYEYGSRLKGVESKPKITKENYNGYVYNLQVKDDESFIADGHVVHNCVISLALAAMYMAAKGKKDKRMPIVR